MKRITWKDSSGRNHVSIVRDEDPEDRYEEGIAVEPPPIDDILEDAKIDLHNELVARQLFTAKDLSRARGALQGAINKVIKRRIVLRFNEKDN